ncbi:MAG: DNA polymerase III subunit delta' [Nitrospirales bacterium]|nr:DNA polymerase III subunit delta' [Nitrospira sp.]MDR4502116.1 DNA polymerase III subunit delta' [Nitrospirales bacterium]
MPFQDIIGHSTQIEWLRRAITSNRLAHGYLFVGDPAIGKGMTALRFIQAMNCESHTLPSPPDACGQCRTCLQIAARNHPDMLVIEPDESQGQYPQIKIERIREIEHHVIYRPLFADKKICLIDDADRLTIGAANALLKTLEEPPEHCLFILITARPSALLSTIKSRCLTIRFSPPHQTDAINYLMRHRTLSEPDARLLSLLTNARIGEALSLDVEAAKNKQLEFFTLLFEQSDRSITDSLASAETLTKSGQTSEALFWLWSGLRDLLLVATQSSHDELLHQHQCSRLQKIVHTTSSQRILDLLEELYDIEQGMQRNLNHQLRFEQFFVHLQEAFQPV